MNTLAGFEPAELGLPDKFTSFRDCQIEAVEQVLNDPKRFQGLCLPTGSGKSVAAIAIAKATGLRTAILTGTLGLQEQYLQDFGSCGLVDIRGKSNYPCAGVRNANCRIGPLDGCLHTGDLGCTYECQRYEAKQARIVSTNYAYWTRINERSRGLELTTKEGGPNPLGLLICDEAHRVFEELAKSLQVTVREQWLRSAGFSLATDLRGHSSDDIDHWRQSAAAMAPVVDQHISELSDEHRKKRSLTGRNRLYELEQLKESLERIQSMQPDSWVCEMQEGTKYGRQWVFDCVWPGQWAESRLFLGIPKVVLLSATLRPAAMTMLGIKKGTYAYREWPRIFPAVRTPVYHIPVLNSTGTLIRLNHRTEDNDLKKWVEKIDDIIGSRQHRKGIIHTVSYSRQRYLLDHSQFTRYMVANTSDPESETAGETLRRFKHSDPPCILVSPSFSTGWDFPGDTCRWQIVTKIAFPDSRSKVMKARKERNETYLSYLAMQDLVQACGRGTRSADDWCECFVVDNGIGWFLMQNKHLAPSWFDVMRVAEIPPVKEFP